MEVLVLSSSSAGNSTALRAGPGQPILLIDAGLSKAETFKRLKAHGWPWEDLAGILISHEHTDHTFGLKGITAMFRTVPIVMSRGTAKAMWWINATYPVKWLQHGEHIMLGDFKIGGVGLAHDANEPLAFTIGDASQIFSYIMDVGTVDDDVRKMLAISEHVFIESNYEPKMLEVCHYRLELKQRIAGAQGHLSNAQVAEVIPDMYILENLILGHISHKANDPEIVRLTAQGVLSADGNIGATLHIAGDEPKFIQF